MLVSFLRRVVREARLYLANYVIAWIPSHRVRLTFYRLVMRAKIGERSSIFMGAWFDIPVGLVIGRRTTVNQNCRLDSRGGLVIGDNVSISADVCILTADHDVQSPDFSGVKAPVVIGDYVFVGTRALVLPGVTLGEGCVIAAGAVVVKSVDPYTIVGGVPARVIGQRSRELAYDVDYRRLFH